MTDSRQQIGSSALRVLRLGFVLGGVVVAVESAVATHDVAVALGVRKDSPLAWLTPAGIEGLAVAFVGAHIYRRAIGLRSWIPLAGAGLFGALAVWINVAAVGGFAARSLAYAMAASAPIGLTLLVHIYPWMGRPESETGAVDRSPEVTPSEPDRPTVASGRVPGQVVATSPVTANDDRDDRGGGDGGREVAGRRPVALHAVRSEGVRSGDRAGQPGAAAEVTAPMPAGPERDAVVDEMLADNPAVKDWEVAQALGGLSERTGRRLLEKARERAERSA